MVINNIIGSYVPTQIIRGIERKLVCESLLDFLSLKRCLRLSGGENEHNWASLMWDVTVGRRVFCCVWSNLLKYSTKFIIDSFIT